MEQKPIKDAIRLLNLYLKQNYIARGMGIGTSTLGNKLAGNITNATDNYVVISRFTEDDVRRFNEWMPRLAEELRSYRISWSSTRQEVVDQVNRFREISNLYYICEQFLGLNRSKVNQRCYPTSTKRGNTSFSQQDIDKLNSFISDLSAVVGQLKVQ
ncbi:MAG: hypothetical protein ACI36Z_01285 [Alloprevotella sp.]